MSKKTDAQHWYQVHKARAGAASVEGSALVSAAREKVRSLTLQHSELSACTTNSISSTLRRSIFGRNALEEQVHQLEIQLVDARSKLLAIEQSARLSGEKAYSSDWVERNPDKAK